MTDEWMTEEEWLQKVLRHVGRRGRALGPEDTRTLVTEVRRLKQETARLEALLVRERRLTEVAERERDEARALLFAIGIRLLRHCREEPAVNEICGWIDQLVAVMAPAALEEPAGQLANIEGGGTVE